MTEYTQGRLGAVSPAKNESPRHRNSAAYIGFPFSSDEHFAAIEPLLEEEHYEFGDVIVKQDDPADSFYVLTRGRARALKIQARR